MAQSYSSDERAVALRVLQRLEGNLSAASRETGISPRTLKRWADGKSIAGKKDGGGNEPGNNDDLYGQTKSLQASLLDTSLQLVQAMGERINDAPLNQLASALGMAVDRFLKLDEYIQQNALAQGEQKLYVEYLYPDGSIHGSPPWARDDSERESAISGGGLREALRQDGNGQDRTGEGGNGWGDVLVAGPDLQHGDGGLAGPQGAAAASRPRPCD